jgi:hypothetical protein
VLRDPPPPAQGGWPHCGVFLVRDGFALGDWTAGVVGLCIVMWVMNRGSKSKEALNLLGSWAATLEQPESVSASGEA